MEIYTLNRFFRPCCLLAQILTLSDEDIVVDIDIDMDHVTALLYDVT